MIGTVEYASVEIIVGLGRGGRDQTVELGLPEKCYRAKHCYYIAISIKRMWVVKSG